MEMYLWAVTAAVVALMYLLICFLDGQVGVGRKIGELEKIIKNIENILKAEEDIESHGEIVVEQNDENSFDVSGTMVVCLKEDCLHYSEGWTNGNCTLKGNDVKNCKLYTLSAIAKILRGENGNTK